MRHTFVAFSLAIAGGILALTLTSHAWADFTGNVVGIADGDTITVLDADKVQHKIRLTGIDAPEKKQPFGNRSKQSLSDMVFNKTVTVETGKRDRYGRELGKVLADGKDVNLERVRAGLAWHYKAYERTQSAADRQKPMQTLKTKPRPLNDGYRLILNQRHLGSGGVGND